MLWRDLRLILVTVFRKISSVFLHPSKFNIGSPSILSTGAVPTGDTWLQIVVRLLEIEIESESIKELLRYV